MPLMAPQLRNAHAQSSLQFVIAIGVSGGEPPRSKLCPGIGFFTSASEVSTWRNCLRK